MVYGRAEWVEHPVLVHVDAVHVGTTGQRRIVGVHGVRGELKVESLTDFPERFDRLAVNLRRFDQRTRFVGHSPDAAVAVVAMGFAQVVLQMADQGIVPVDDIE